MKFKLEKKLKSGVRVGKIKTGHGIIHTPFFMPVGTVGSVKGISPQELQDLGAEIVLANTYHLYLRPGQKIIKKIGGLHQFMAWEGPILTDSGGYQVFSLGKNKSQISNRKSQINIKFQMSNVKNEEDLVNDLTTRLDSKFDPRRKKQFNNQSLVKVMDDGVEFMSHLDGSKHFFTPEKVIQIQLDLGVDILMPLDYCPSGKASKEEIKRSVDITINWAKRSKIYFDSKITNHKSQITNKPQISNFKKEAKKLKSYIIKSENPALFGIVQGGLDLELRKRCTKEIVKLNFDGYAVGGLAVDYQTRNMWQAVKLMGDILPEDKPRHLMGVGTPDDIIKATALGMDMFDCVLPTRLARHGSVYLKSQTSNLKPTSQNLKINTTFPIKSKEANNNRTTEQSNDAYKLINLLNSKYRNDGKTIDTKCGCPACAGGFSKAYISHLIREKEMLGMRLATLHNLYVYLDLIKNYS